MQSSGEMNSPCGNSSLRSEFTAQAPSPACAGRPPEEWLIFENTHEAIVDPETWKLAQRSRQTVR
ncbi:MAG: hypothetical protein HFF26_08760, partial [Oscillospiraceae bacterium]|nr:hypothetical protein [Oscillospiraceae bacterium]